MSDLPQSASRSGGWIPVSERKPPCPPGCCVMAETKDVRSILAAHEADEDEAPVPELQHSGATPRTDAAVSPSAAMSASDRWAHLVSLARQLERELAGWKKSCWIAEDEANLLRSTSGFTYEKGLEDAYNRLRRQVNASNFMEADAHNQALWDTIRATKPRSAIGLRK